jgi:hypothetical protein
VQGCDGSDAVDLWNEAGSNQQWRFALVSGTTDTYTIAAESRAGCARYLSVPPCRLGKQDRVGLSAEAGVAQQFILIPDGTPNAYYIKAVGRTECDSALRVEYCDESESRSFNWVTLTYNQGGMILNNQFLISAV